MQDTDHFISEGGRGEELEKIDIPNFMDLFCPTMEKNKNNDFIENIFFHNLTRHIFNNKKH